MTGANMLGRGRRDNITEYAMIKDSVLLVDVHELVIRRDLQHDL